MLTATQARQLNVIRSAGLVRRAHFTWSVRGLTGPVVDQLIKLGLVAKSMEIATHKCRGTGGWHAGIFTAV